MTGHPDGSSRLIGLVDGNNFYVSCERAVDPRLNGRPVAVLSNNDGCCVAMSPEFKALGIPRGTPYFRLQDREWPRGELVFRSSNYELYGDLSRRIIAILRDRAAEVEQYSIDEAFIRPPVAETDALDYGRRLRSQILRWVGIPCGVGFAATKTLAKIANHLAKKTATGVFVMPDDATDILRRLAVDEVWGIGSRLPARLRAERIVTALDLRNAPDDLVRSVGGITLWRTATELKGTPCIVGRSEDERPDSISCSRSFGTPVTDMDALMESLASFTAEAAAKLRRYRMLAAGCNIYAQTAKAGMFGDDGGWENSFVGRTVMFPRPTDATNVMLHAIRRELGAVFLPGERYRKSGVVFFGLERADMARQGELFDSEPVSASSTLYESIDRLNQRLGRGKVFAAAQGMGRLEWQMKRSKLSKRATTRWDELLTVR